MRPGAEHLPFPLHRSSRRISRRHRHRWPRSSSFSSVNGFGIRWPASAISCWRRTSMGLHLLGGPRSCAAQSHFSPLTVFPATRFPVFRTRERAPPAAPRPYFKGSAGPVPMGQLPLSRPQRPWMLVDQLGGLGLGEVARHAPPPPHGPACSGRTPAPPSSARPRSSTLLDPSGPDSRSSLISLASSARKPLPPVVAGHSSAEAPVIAMSRKPVRLPSHSRLRRGLAADPVHRAGEVQSLLHGPGSCSCWPGG